MSSNNLSLEDGSLDDLNEILSDKETQTSTIYITDSFTLVKGPSRPLPKGVDKTDVEGKVDDNILHCRVIKDPSDSKEEILTESFVKDIANVSTSEEKKSQRQKYCKEVTPYLKPRPNDCEESNHSLEKLVKDTLEDSPDYQPCHEVFEGKQDIQEKTLGRISKNRKMDTVPTTEKDKEVSNKGCPVTEKCRKKSENLTSSELVPSSSSKITKCQRKPAVDPDETNKDMKTSISADSLAQCIKESLTALKRTASTCLEKVEIVMGIKRPENPDEKPTYYAIEKPKEKCNESQNVQTETGNSLKGLKNLLHNHNDNIITIREAVKDLAGKFYKSSIDAVTSITSDSAKFFCKDKTDIHINESNTQNIKTDSIASFFFQKAENKPVIDDSSTNPNDIPAIGSSPATISPGTIINKIASDIASSRIDRSSKYDIPLPKEVATKLPGAPEAKMPTVSAIDHPDPQSASNMFMIIKSKIFSIFRDNTEDADADEEGHDDDEEDPFERFMEQ